MGARLLLEYRDVHVGMYRNQAPKIGIWGRVPVGRDGGRFPRMETSAQTYPSRYTSAETRRASTDEISFFWASAGLSRGKRYQCTKSMLSNSQTFDPSVVFFRSHPRTAVGAVGSRWAELIFCFCTIRPSPLGTVGRHFVPAHCPSTAANRGAIIGPRSDTLGI